LVDFLCEHGELGPEGQRRHKEAGDGGAYLELQIWALGAKISPAASVSLKEHLQEMDTAGAQLHSEDSAADAQWRHNMSSCCFDRNSGLRKGQNRRTMEARGGSYVTSGPGRQARVVDSARVWVSDETRV
jgi:hypothetical protein